MRPARGFPGRLGGALAIVIAVAASSPARSASLDFFTWAPRVSDGTRRVLALFESGELLAAAAEAGAALERPGEQPFREELLLLRGLALADARWREDAESPLAELLDSENPSPYYPLALLELVELRHEAGRLEAVAAACDRYADARWSGGTRRDARVRRFLDAYGEVREGGPRLTEREEDLLAHPVRLAESAAPRKERPTERLLYLCGIDRLRLGRFAASLDAFDRIGLLGAYEPWAMVGAAQALYASGDVDGALARLDRLRRLPAPSVPDDEIRARAALLGAQMLFAAGRDAEASAAARDVGKGRWGRVAAILRAEIALALEQPALALATAGDEDEGTLDGRLVAERALVVGAAYARLGDDASASAALRRGAARLASERAPLESANGQAEVERLRAAVLADGRIQEEAAASRRTRLVAGIRRVLALRGPMSIGKLARIVATSHRSSIVGRPVYDLSGLASEDPRPVALDPEGGAARLAYLRSPLRQPLADAAAAEIALGARPDDPTTSIDALLGLLAGRFRTGGSDCTDERARTVSALLAAYSPSEGREPTALCGADIVPRLRELRAHLLAPPSGARIPRLPGELRDRVRREAGAGIDAALTAGLRQVVAGEARELRRLGFELDSALSEAMLRENAAARERSAPRP